MADEAIKSLAVKIALDDGSFSQGMKNLKTQMNVVDSQFKSSVAGVKNWGSSLDGLKANATALGDKMNVQNQIIAKYAEQLSKSKEALEQNSQKLIDNKVKVESARKAYEDSVTSIGKNAEETKKLKEELKKAESAFKSSENVVRNNNNTINGYTIQLNNAKSALNKMDSELTENNLKVKTSESTIGKLKSALAGLTNQSKSTTSSMSGHFASLKSTLLGLGIGTAIAGVAKSVFTTSANFEQEMSNIQAVSGATANEIKKLSDTALKAGADTTYSASEAASAEEELIKAGLTTSQVINGGLTGALNLAAAGGIDLADAAEVASTALNAFKDDNLSVADAADILAGAANASATNVSELKLGLSQVSSVASGMGMSFKDTSTALAAFAQNGLKGSDAGTSLKSMLLNLQPQTDKQVSMFKQLSLVTADGASKFYDANGSMKSLNDISGLLQTSLSGLTDAQRATALETMFGTDAIRAGNILYKEGTKGITDMAAAMSKVSAADVAAQKMDNFKGKLEAFKGTLETVEVTIGEEVLPNATDAIKSLDSEVKTLNWKQIAGEISNAVSAAFNIFKTAFNFVTEHGELVKNVVIGITTAVVAWKVAIGVANTVQTISNSLQALGIIQSGAAATAKVAETVATTGATVAQWSLNAAMDANPIGAVIAIIAVAVAAIAALTVGIIALVKHFQESSIETQKFGDNVSKSTQKAVTSFNDLNTKADTALKELAWSGGVVTKKMADTITANINAMADQTIKAFNKQRDGSIKAVTDLAASTGTITKAEADAMVANINKGYDERIAKEAQAQARINEIINTAANEHRAKTQQENIEISQLKDQMHTAGIQSLSKNQVEEQAIFDNMRINHSATSAEEAAAIVKNSKDSTDKVIADANKEYNDRIAVIIRERDETHSIKSDEADKLIKAAQKERDDSVSAAQDMHGKVVSEAQAQAGDLVNKVDWQNGQVKSKWKVFCDGWVETWSYMKERSHENWVNIQNGWNEFWDGFSSGAKSGWNSFTNSWNNFWGGIHDAFTNLHPIEWGKDLMNGIAKGIKDAAHAVGDAAKGVAQDIRKFLHFSVPDEGPLVDYETWMPDMMGGLAKGIANSKHLVTNALKGSTTDMSLNINTASIPRSKLNGIVNNNITTNNYSTDSISKVSKTSNAPTILNFVMNGKAFASATIGNINKLQGTTSELRLDGGTC